MQSTDSRGGEEDPACQLKAQPFRTIEPCRCGLSPSLSLSLSLPVIVIAVLFAVTETVTESEKRYAKETIGYVEGLSELFFSPDVPLFLFFVGQLESSSICLA